MGSIVYETASLEERERFVAHGGFPVRDYSDLTMKGTRGPWVRITDKRKPELWLDGCFVAGWGAGVLDGSGSCRDSVIMAIMGAAVEEARRKGREEAYADIRAKLGLKKGDTL